MYVGVQELYNEHYMTDDSDEHLDKLDIDGEMQSKSSQLCVIILLVCLLIPLIEVECDGIVNIADDSDIVLLGNGSSSSIMVYAHCNLSSMLEFVDAGVCRCLECNTCYSVISFIAEA